MKIVLNFCDILITLACCDSSSDIFISHNKYTSQCLKNNFDFVLSKHKAQIGKGFPNMALYSCTALKCARLGF